MNLNEYTHTFKLFIVLLGIQQFHQRANSAPTNEEAIMPSAGCTCTWTEWLDNDDYLASVGDDNSYENLRRNNEFCLSPVSIQCREKANRHLPYFVVGLNGMKCDVTSGLVCISNIYDPATAEYSALCPDYEIRVKCCECPPKTTTLATTEMTMTESTTFVVTTIKVETTGAFFDSIPLEYDYEGNIVQHEPVPKHHKWLQLTMVILICVAVFSLILFLYFCRKKCAKAHQNERRQTQNYYGEYEQKTPKPSLNFYMKPDLSSSGDSLDSSSARDYELSDIEEDYSITNGRHNRRRSRSERDRIKNGHYDREQSMEETKTRQWFPDEHTRRLELQSSLNNRPKA